MLVGKERFVLGNMAIIASTDKGLYKGSVVCFNSFKMCDRKAGPSREAEIYIHSGQ
jgi:hypothetical protein